MIANGTSPKVVQKQLGHAKVTTTMETYVRVLKGQQEEASDKLGALLHG